MKRIGRALCLMLSLALLLGAAAVPAGAAAFSDSGGIVHTEAVDTLAALNIISGKPGGFFDPDGAVTRAEMAKLICVALNGGKLPRLGTVPCSYSDTAGHWASDCIAYCTALGIVCGRGGGLFDPDGAVTGTEAAKMLLAALGYDAAAEGFTGSGWALAADVRANQKGLYEDLDGLDPSAGLTRDGAAQMVYNAVRAAVVEYTYQLIAVDGVLTTAATAVDGDGTILQKRFDLSIGYGVITNVSYDADRGEYTYTVIPDGGCGVTSFTSGTDYSGLFLMDARILYKGDNTGSVYGVFARNSRVLLSGVVGGLPGIAAGDTFFRYDGAGCRIDSGGIPVYAFNADAGAGSLCSYRSDGTAPYGFNLIDNDGDGRGDLLVVYPYTVEQVTYVGASTFATTAGSVTKADVSCPSGLAKGDFVKVTAAGNTARGTDTYEKIADVLSGEVSATRDAGASFRLGGTWYTIAAARLSASEATAVAGSAYREIAVVNGYAFNLTASGSGPDVSDYAVVLAAASGAGTLSGPQAKLLFSDGTTAVVDTANDCSTGYRDRLVTFTAKDGTYTLALAKEDAADSGFDTVLAAPDGADADADDLTAAYVYKAGGKSAIGGDRIAPDAVVFVKNDQGWSVVTGAELAQYGSAAVYNAYADENAATGFSAVALACVSSNGVSGEIRYGYVTEEPKTVRADDGRLVCRVTFWTGAETVTADTTAADSDASLAGLAEGTLISYAEAGGAVEIRTVTVLGPDTAAAVTAYADDEIRFGDSPVYTLTGDTVLLYIDAEDHAGAESGRIQLASDADASGGRIDNVCYAAGTSGELLFLAVDVRNDILDVE